MEEGHNITMLPISDIDVINPRSRNKKRFHELVDSISKVGLKKPITVSRRSSDNRYNLVCGQGRIEAFLMLGQSQIPAIVLDINEEDCLVRSLVENVARRNHSPLELARAVVALREKGYSNSLIAEKIGYSDEYVYALLTLFDHGEDRLITAVEKGIVPSTIAIEIARAKDANVQLALTEAYESKAIPGNQIMAIRKIIDQRNAMGKGIAKANGTPANRRRVSATSLVRAFQKEADRQKLVIKRANITQRHLLVIVNGIKMLLADDHFSTLLRAESIGSMPKPIVDRMRLGAAQ